MKFPPKMSPNAKKNILYSLVLLGMVLLVYLYRNSTGNTGTGEEIARKNGLISWEGKFMEQPYLFFVLSRASKCKS